jgi:hypothetical protein
MDHAKPVAAPTMPAMPENMPVSSEVPIETPAAPAAP